jgi:uncharacterized caspase-like protein
MSSTKILVAILPLFLAGCFGSSGSHNVPAPQQQPHDVRQNRAVPQRQPRNVQQDRPMQGLRNPETQHIRDPKAMPQAQPQTQCPVHLEEQRRRQQEQAAEETRQLEQARQSSLRTYEEEQRRRQERAIEEGRQLGQVRQESLRTHKEEEKRRQDRQAEEAAVGWEPSSWQLVQAGKFVRELYQSKGEQRPSQDEMSAHLQSKMGLTPPQARIILEELGV